MYSWKFVQKCLLFTIVCVCVLFAYCSYTGDSYGSDEEYPTNFDYECIRNGSEEISHITHICFEEPHVFFVETSKSTILTPRQACAIESTARHNPSLEVLVLMTGTDPIKFDDPLMKTLITVPNIKIIQINIEVLFHGSPLFDWYRAKKWEKSKWKASHLSDALRFFLVWKYGGMYLDTDIVTFQSMEHLKNVAITEDWNRVASGILIFDKGHDLLKNCMFDFAANYDPFDFVSNGPGVLTHNIKAFCDINNIGKVSGANCNVDILPPEAAFPIPCGKWEEYFIPSFVKNVADKFNSSYLIHVWNKFSKNLQLRIGTNSLYELAVKQHCPIVYKYAEQLGYM
ncbi:lactosylceramide 4-alpha-galactosyltransferase-like [Stegodyphus dumicola]|uniref:lactosylceramide 4-alpha-galactosyltransferase-like n=1 Tax=Stegodyphus dumicola TaxID=202533 RepID=UPI0015B00F69|nr:lactosylceramide 4-alpha-galactosyltransferase-like [Stegodyphus dumicola]